MNIGLSITKNEKKFFKLTEKLRKNFPEFNFIHLKLRNFQLNIMYIKNAIQNNLKKNLVLLFINPNFFNQR